MQSIVNASKLVTLAHSMRVSGARVHSLVIKKAHGDLPKNSYVALFVELWIPTEHILNFPVS